MKNYQDTTGVKSNSSSTININVRRNIKSFRYLLFLSLVLCLIFIYLNSSQSATVWSNTSEHLNRPINSFISTINYHLSVENSTELDSTKLDANTSENGGGGEDFVIQYLKVYNDMGAFGSNWEKFTSLLGQQKGSSLKKTEIFNSTRETYLKIQDKKKRRNSTDSTLQNSNGTETKNRGTPQMTTQINLAAVACGKRKDEAMVMLKSAVMFTQHTHLHLILFSDKSTILDLAKLVLELKWSVMARGWDLTYELHLDWFPNDEWKEMWGQCSTQRLFFPTLLPHIDSLIYLDSDIVVVSNLTDLWDNFQNHMGQNKLAAMAPNNENTAVGWYNTMSKVPYFGQRGVNAGMMLMNLTQMRQFNLQDKSVSIHTVFKEKIELADQDILNTLFNGYPEKLHVLNCSFNFNWVHCGHEKVYPCHNETGHNRCFCRSVLQQGVKIVHGNGKTFYNPVFPFLQDIFSQFQKFDLILDSEVQLILRLQEHFRSFKNSCSPLTAELLYNNAIKYLKSVAS